MSLSTHKNLDKFIDKIKSIRDGDQKSVNSALTDYKVSPGSPSPEAQSPGGGQPGGGGRGEMTLPRMPLSVEATTGKQMSACTPSPQLDMNESLVETLHEECKKNNVECPIQSSELRSRVRKASAPPQDRGTDKGPSESWWDWVCRMFHSTVQMLREIWQDVLRPWLLDCYEAICDTLLPLSNMLKSLSYSV
ncbi:uncharacterized protein LOC132533057 isoform X2 [Erinaceus europaeus]|uniref:Uncharacterized protein LOC132533057 isoform X2 n=1 Tax=Erinaceus europaeus TaxID=9365 RepID=A0ABM3VVZ5_ERIEU|nr:uncharacterized protein LOC132533057 isoform X2 [Erinaceus europaeus]